MRSKNVIIREHIYIDFIHKTCLFPLCFSSSLIAFSNVFVFVAFVESLKFELFYLNPIQSVARCLN